MNAKKMCAILTVVSLVVPAVALALDPPVAPPTVSIVGDAMTVSWVPVDGAAKYSVDLEGTVTYGAGLTAYVELSFGTSDRTDGALMSDPYLVLSILNDIATPIATQLGVTVDDLVQIDGLVKVKALAPGKGAGAQNSEFSPPAYGTLVF